MKALVYREKNTLEKFQIKLEEVSDPILNAESVAVDYRSIAKIPYTAPFDHVAGAPIATMTARESLFRDHDKLPEGVKNVLVLGAAGGVGAMAVQLLKARTDVQVIATASRNESVEWLQQFNPDVILDHSQNVPEQLRGH
jgi:NADPH:quinone reductase-like Zn-dependent oxidoreductase